MSDARARAVERAHRLADDPVADEARRIAEHLRAGGRDPRLDPAADDVVQERQRVCVHAGARVVLRTWPRVLTWEVTALPMTAEGGEPGTAALERALEQRSLSLGRLVPGARVLYIGTAVRRPRPGRRGWDRVEAQTAPGVWAVYHVEAGILEHRTAARLDLTRVDPAWRVHEAPPAEEVEWRSLYLSDHSDVDTSRQPSGRGYGSRIHAWRDWCRGGRVVRLGAAPG